MAIDLSQILQDYDDDAFGFSAVSEEEYNKAISESADTVDELKERLQQVEKMVMPFLVKMLKTSDKAYIYWPNRKALLEDQIKKILSLTRV
jgi:hypothetical protein